MSRRAGPRGPALPLLYKTSHFTSKTSVWLFSTRRPTQSPNPTRPFKPDKRLTELDYALAEWAFVGNRLRHGEHPLRRKAAQGLGVPCECNWHLAHFGLHEIAVMTIDPTPTSPSRTFQVLADDLTWFIKCPELRVFHITTSASDRVLALELVARSEIGRAHV